MKSQERRDEESVTIFTGVLLFLLITAVCAVVLVLADRIGGLDGDALDVLVYIVLAGATAASIRYVYRHRRR